VRRTTLPKATVMYQRARAANAYVAKTGAGEALMESRAEQLDDMAWECRALARAATHATIREQLLEIAEQFERLARHQRRSGIRTLVRLTPEI